MWVALIPFAGSKRDEHEPANEGDAGDEPGAEGTSKAPVLAVDDLRVERWLPHVRNNVTDAAKAAWGSSAAATPEAMVLGDFGPGSVDDAVRASTASVTEDDEGPARKRGPRCSAVRRRRCGWLAT